MPHVAWTLSDLSSESPEVLTFPINPREFSPPTRRAGIQWMRPVAPNGQAVIFQGLNEVPSGSFSGAVLDGGFFEDLDEWASKWYPLVLTDDLSNSWEILITEISWTRLRRAINPHRYDYTVQFVAIL